MVRSSASTVQEYLKSLPDDRRRAVAAVRQVVRRYLPPGYRESMGFGMITYVVPLSRYPDTYNGQPLCYVALASQKRYMALYLMSVYQDRRAETRLKAAFKKAGKRLDMGKSCIRFRALDDLPLDVIGRVVAGTPVEAFIAQYEAARKR